MGTRRNAHTRASLPFMLELWSEQWWGCSILPECSGDWASCSVLCSLVHSSPPSFVLCRTVIWMSSWTFRNSFEMLRCRKIQGRKENLCRSDADVMGKNWAVLLSHQHHMSVTYLQWFKLSSKVFFSTWIQDTLLWLCMERLWPSSLNSKQRQRLTESSENCRQLNPLSAAGAFCFLFFGSWALLFYDNKCLNDTINIDLEGSG